jgi:hypothetical protein
VKIDDAWRDYNTPIPLPGFSSDYLVNLISL